MGEPIVALATPPLRSALALVRSSGEGVFRIAETLLGKLMNLEKRDSYVGYWKDASGEKVDQVVVISYPPHSSLTGEEVVEVITHGNPLIAERVCESFISLGARYATNGEFTSRAYLNGKLDIVEAEAVNDLINAASEESRKLSLLALEGKSSGVLRPIREKLGELLASFEVGFDFPEYEEETRLEMDKAVNLTDEILDGLRSLVSDGEEGKKIKDGLDVALVGKPNVGKSSILNALLKEEKAIVSPFAGTTRDVVEGSLIYKGLRFRFLDTAGLRENPEEIESLGIEKSLASVNKADMVVLVLDEDRKLDDEETDIERKVGQKPFLVCVNKTDIHEGEGKDPNRVYVSAIKGERMPILDALVRLSGVSPDAFSRPALTSTRQLGLLRSAISSLEEAKKNAVEGNLDLASSAVLSAYTDVKNVLGVETSLDLSDEIFSRFCVGK